jgi:SAM-dependent methyltransferase
MNQKDKYLAMQKKVFDELASKSNYRTAEYTLRNDREFVVSSYAAHERFDYEKYLFYWLVDETNDKLALDYGCGPGRMIKRLFSRFRRVDGVDISSKVLECAQQCCRDIPNKPILYLTDGQSLSMIGSEIYDIVYSVICLQHICMYTIRLNIIKEAFRVLKYNGCFTFQMGYGIGHDKMIRYYEDYAEADSTNGAFDVCVLHPYEIAKDLIDVGFSDVRYVICPTGPGDIHSGWLFVSATKLPKQNMKISNPLKSETLESMEEDYAQYTKLLFEQGILSYCNALKERVIELNRSITELNDAVTAVKNSYSYKIGLALTYPIREAVRFFAKRS